MYESRFEQGSTDLETGQELTGGSRVCGGKGDPYTAHSLSYIAPRKARAEAAHGKPA